MYTNFVQHRHTQVVQTSFINIFESCKYVRNNIQFYILIKTVKRDDRNENKLKLPQTTLQLINSGSHSMLIRIYNHVTNCIKNNILSESNKIVSCKKKRIIK